MAIPESLQEKVALSLLDQITVGHLEGKLSSVGTIGMETALKLRCGAETTINCG